MTSNILENHPLTNTKISFKLTNPFIKKYETLDPPFGFNGLGELVYYRTYSRLKKDGTNEKWFETVRRVVEGTYSMQKRWVIGNHLGWDEAQAQRSAQEMYDRMFNMKFLPPGRGLWAMGSELTEERKLFVALNNCAFVSTENLDRNPTYPFKFLMDGSMLGIGVGFDTKGEGKVIVKQPKADIKQFEIPDTREGWVDSLEALLGSYFEGTQKIEFDYSKIRKAGEPIKGFGGISSGFGPLKEMHDSISKLLDSIIGETVTATAIVDLMNLIGRCVVSGNIRRTAEIAFGEPSSVEYLDLKNYKKNPHRKDWGWASNNSIFASVGMNYNEIEKRIVDNGEPGLAWLDNMRAYGRMVDKANYKDKRVAGGNPCLEQSLESEELCCLVETFPAKHESLDDFKRTLKFAYLYAKTVTLGPTPWEKTNKIMSRNRRIGCSMSGIAQAISKMGLEEFRKWCEEGYQTIQQWDEIYSDWLAIHKSIKTTSIKPSGSVSLLNGSTPGMHFPESKTYIRRVRLSKYSELIKPLKKAGYVIEDAKQEPDTVIVEIPVKIEDNVRTVAEVSMWEQLNLAAFLQTHWADNQVSCTVSFDPKTEGNQIANALNYFQYRLKGISFLPKTELGAYEQMPYEEITDKAYVKMMENIKPLKINIKNEEVEVERFCDNSSCQI